MPFSSEEFAQMNDRAADLCSCLVYFKKVVNQVNEDAPMCFRLWDFLFMYNVQVNILESNTFFVCFSTVMHTPGPALQVCNGSCHENVPDP